MADFADKTAENSSHFTLTPGSVPKLDPLTQVSLLDGHSITVQDEQVPSGPVSANYNTMRYPGQGQYNNGLASGGLVQVIITRGNATGRNLSVPYVRVHVSNTTGAPVSLTPVPFFWNNIQCLNTSSSPCQNHDGSGLWGSIIESYENDAWQNIMEAVNSSPDYEEGYPIPDQTVAVFLCPLIGNYLGTAKFPMFILDGDLYFNFNFASPTATVISGSAPQISFFSLDIMMEQLSDSDRKRIRADRGAMPVTYIYPYEKIQRLSQNWAASQRYNIQLSQITGDVNFGRALLRNSLAGVDLFHYNLITDFQILNAAGNPITGAQVIDDVYNRRIQQVDWFAGSASQHRHKYAFVWSANKNAALSFMLHGVKYGAYPFTAFETFVLDTAPAGRNEVLTLDSASTGAVGNFQLGWATPIQGAELQLSAPIAWNAAASDIVAAIEAIPTFQGSVTATGGILGTNPVVLTFGKNYGNKNLFGRGYQLFVTNSNVTTSTGGTLTALSVSLTTAGIDGITNNGSYFFDFQAYVSAFCTIRSGQIETYISS